MAAVIDRRYRNKIEIMKQTLLTVIVTGAVWAASVAGARGQEYSSLGITYQPPGTTNDGTASTNAVPRLDAGGDERRDRADEVQTVARLSGSSTL